MNNGVISLTSFINEGLINIKNTIYLITKRVFDFIIGLIGLVFIIPVALVVKISYILTGDFKSIIYSQERIGKKGKPFKMYKFRSMVPNADEELKELLKIKKYKEEWDKNQKINDDPRITKAGRILRKTSLDELPQFINIIKGDISLIGPRPLVKGELDAHNGNHKIYESVKPGITGWWAVNGRSATTYEERLALEYYYVKHKGIKMDLLCMIKTVFVVIKRTGAK